AGSTTEQYEDARAVGGSSGKPARGLEAGGDGAGQADGKGADTPGLKKLAPSQPRQELLSAAG
ncbi:MAG: hypothetical protein ACRELG_11550, partial [Gemmataceae bacterium]